MAGKHLAIIFIILTSLHKLIMKQGIHFFYEYGLILLIIIGMTYLFIERCLVFFFTRLTITDKSIIYKNPYNNIELLLHEIEGYTYHAKGRYVIYSKHDRKKRIIVDTMLNKSDELMKYISATFTKLE